MLAEFCKESLFRFFVGYITGSIDEGDERMLLRGHSFEMGQSFPRKLKIGVHVGNNVSSEQTTRLVQEVLCDGGSCGKSHGELLVSSRAGPTAENFHAL